MYYIDAQHRQSSGLVYTSLELSLTFWDVCVCKVSSGCFVSGTQYVLTIFLRNLRRWALDTTIVTSMKLKDFL